MIDHFILPVSDIAASKEFYEKCLDPLGYRVVWETDDGVAFSILEKPDFFIKQGEAVAPAIHLAFMSRDRTGVDSFYKVAMEAGARDNGPPGIRENYHPNYYGAFVLDPDGHNIEAVCHQPE